VAVPKCDPGIPRQTGKRLFETTQPLPARGPSELGALPVRRGRSWTCLRAKQQVTKQGTHVSVTGLRYHIDLPEGRHE
jgi:hypothetical protein